jgi:L-ribulose-5-phosphate 4-epimerase
MSSLQARLPKSSLKALREEVLEANFELVRRGLVLYTFGNASGISRDEGVVLIKPSGVPYDEMKPDHLVMTDLDGRILEGSLRPSSDLPTHLVLYRAFPEIGGIVHTHSEYATAWAQARREIPCFGTTHADYFHGPVPVTEPTMRSQASMRRTPAAQSCAPFATAAQFPYRVSWSQITGHSPGGQT